ncbi:MAG TPA: hypothetical protein VMV17_11280 [Streptosporangiaceae bacterium]|nr:hypothetical protein [Streptosporangiaceae bacterium]
MAKAKRRTSNPTTKRPLDETWNEIANDEKAFIGAATKAVERVPCWAPNWLHIRRHDSVRPERQRCVSMEVAVTGIS